MASTFEKLSLGGANHQAVLELTQGQHSSDNNEFQTNEIVIKLMPYFPELAKAYIEYLKDSKSQKEAAKAGNGNSNGNDSSPTPSSASNATFSQYFQAKLVQHQKVLELNERDRKNRFDYSGKTLRAPSLSQHPASETAEITGTVAAGLNSNIEEVTGDRKDRVERSVEREAKGSNEKKGQSDIPGLVKSFTFNHQDPDTLTLIATTVGQYLALEQMIEAEKLSGNFNQYQIAMLDQPLIRRGIIFEFFAANKPNNVSFMQTVIERNVAQYGNHDSYMNLLLQNYRNVQFINTVFPLFLERAFREGITPERVWQLIGNVGHPLAQFTSTLFLYCLVHEIELKVVQEIIQNNPFAVSQIMHGELDNLVPAIILKNFRSEDFKEILNSAARCLDVLSEGVSPSKIVEVIKNPILQSCSNDIFVELLKCNVSAKALIQLVNKYPPNTSYSDYFNLFIPCLKHGIPMEIMEEALKLKLHVFYQHGSTPENIIFYKEKAFIVYLLKAFSLQTLQELRSIAEQNKINFVPVQIADVIRMNLSLTEIAQFVRLGLGRENAYGFGFNKDVYTLLGKGVTAIELQTLAKRHLQRLLLLEKDLKLSKEEVLNIQFEDVDIETENQRPYFKVNESFVQGTLEALKALFVKLQRDAAIKFLNETLPKLSYHQVEGLQLGLDPKQIMDERCTEVFIRLMKNKKYSWLDLADLEHNQLVALNAFGLIKGENKERALRRNPSVFTLEQLKSSREWWTDLHLMALSCGRKFNEIAGKPGKELLGMLGLTVPSSPSPMLYSAAGLAVGPVASVAPSDVSAKPGHQPPKA